MMRSAGSTAGALAQALRVTTDVTTRARASGRSALMIRIGEL
jgi:hypothetical protein